jgi:glutathione synthase/RimK-type ligase-like ATP-grasp enzyme
MNPLVAGRKSFSCTPDVIDQLALAEGSNLNLYYKDEILHIGPVFGILANLKFQNGEIRGQQIPIFEHLLTLAADERMFAYVFGMQEMLSQTGFKSTLRGYVMQKKNGVVKWNMRDVPFPDVVYDQIVSRKFEKLPDVAAMKQELVKTLGNSYFNQGFFDKWQVHQWLTEHETTKDYLPATIKHQDPDQTAAFLEQHKQVYMKPIHGSLGMGIIKVLRLADGRYYYQIKGQRGIQTQGYTQSAKGLLKKLKKRLTKRSYIVQEALHLQTYLDRPFDIRILMQKGKNGKWIRTKAVCRIAQSGDITSNLSSGGEALPLLKILKEIYPGKEDVKKIQRKIRSLVNTIPPVMEQVSGMQLGEMGLDIGIDNSGNVWIIEVNSKPWKKPVTEQGSMEIVMESFRRPLLYGKYLTGTA